MPQFVRHLQAKLNLSHKQKFALLSLGFSATCVCILHYCYYRIFPWVLSFNVVFPKGTLTPLAEMMSQERDGIEIYVLYIFMFVSLLLARTLAFDPLFLKKRWAHFLMLLGSVGLIGTVTFTPPSETSGPVLIRLLAALVASAFVIALLKLQKKISPKVESILALIFLLPICFVALSPVSADNYAYVFAPAQKMLEGVPLSKIYIQYDLFLTSFAALWMKLDLNLVGLQIVGRLSIYVWIATLFFLARKLFLRRSTGLLFLLSLILVKIFSAPWDPAFDFQLTPLRLDLWLLPFCAIYFLGLRHWLVILILGILLLTHGPFGFLYTIGFVQLIATLAAISIWDHGFKVCLQKWRQEGVLTSAILKLVFLVTCYGAARMIFAENLHTTSWYQKIGLGFIPMSKTSFYWAVPVLISPAFALLFRMHKELSAKYLTSGFLLIYFTLGNSIYFFGRSHELCVFSISLILLFAAFFAVDIFDRWMTENKSASQDSSLKNATTIIASIFLASIVYRCADQIRSNTSAMFSNVQQHQLSMGDPFAENQAAADAELADIRQQIGSSARLQFLVPNEGLEFAFYQRAHNNLSYIYPNHMWLFRKELLQYAQSVLDQGFYLIIDKSDADSIYEGQLTRIGYRYVVQSGKFVVLAATPPAGN